MRTGWETKPLGAVCEVIGGGTPSKGVASYYGGNIPWATVRDLKSDVIDSTEHSITQKAVDSSATNIIPKGNVVIATRVGLGKVCLLGQDTAINQDLRGIVPKDGKLAVRFLYHWLRSVAPNIVSEGTGATVQGVKLPFIKGLQIPVPPRQEQERIVAILEKAFEGIATAKANAEKNLKNARDLFDGRLAEVFSTSWRSAKIVKLAQLATDIVDGDHMPPPKAPSGVPFVTISNIDKQSHAIDFSDTYFVSKAYFDNLKENRKPRRGDLLYTVTGSYGIPVEIEDDREFCFQRHIGMIRPKPDVSTSWLYYLVRSPQLRRQADERATGTAQKTVSLSILRDFDVPQMGVADQQKIATELERFELEVERLERVQQDKLLFLDQLKQSLLHQAFSGKL